MAGASLLSVPRPPRSDQVVRPTGPTELPIARLTGAGRDDTSRAGVPVSGTGTPGTATGSGKASSSPALPGSLLPRNGSPTVVPGTTPLLSERLGAMLQEFGIPRDTAAFFAIKALMSEGLGLGVEAIKAVRAIALRHAEPGRAAEVSARALAAGLQADDDGLDALIQSLSGLVPEEAGKGPDRISSRQSGRDPGRDSDRDSGRDSDRNPDGQTSPGHDGPDSRQGDEAGQKGEQPVSTQNMVRRELQDEPELREALGSFFLDVSSRAAADPGFASLARRGPDGRGWLCVPYRFSLDSVDFSGYFRIVFNYATHRVERLVAEIDSSRLTRVFDVSWGLAGKPKLRFMPGTPSEAGEFEQIFGASMKVEFVQPRRAADLIDAYYKEVDGHA